MAGGKWQTFLNLLQNPTLLRNIERTVGISVPNIYWEISTFVHFNYIVRSHLALRLQGVRINSVDWK